MARKGLKPRTAGSIARNKWVFDQMARWAGPILWLVGMGGGAGLFAGCAYVGFRFALHRFG